MATGIIELESEQRSQRGNDSVEDPLSMRFVNLFRQAGLFSVIRGAASKGERVDLGGNQGKPPQSLSSDLDGYRGAVQGSSREMIFESQACFKGDGSGSAVVARHNERSRTLPSSC